MKILVIDSIYPDFLKSLPFDPSSTYEVELQKVLDRKFGTFDAYSMNLRALGHDCMDVIANHEPLQKTWAREHGLPVTNHAWAALEAQANDFKPDCIFMQDLSIDPPTYQPRILAGQLSCPWPGDERVRQYDVLYTSFPHYVPRIEALGVRAVYNPLAFEASLAYEQLDATCSARPEFISGEMIQRDRIHDCVFIGGVGNPSHWREGMKTLELIAREIPTFKWWGYGVETLPEESALRSKYRGAAFGLDMYQILLQSKIVINRHGEVAEGYANNMRLYEATGCGAMLLTEEAKNVWDLFSVNEVQTYLTLEHAVQKIRYYLSHDSERTAIAKNGQTRTLAEHTYANRMKTVSKKLQEMLCPA